jgi:hypothetical protein
MIVHSELERILKKIILSGLSHHPSVYMKEIKNIVSVSNYFCRKVDRDLLLNKITLRSEHQPGPT